MSAPCFSRCHFLHAVFMDITSLHNNDHDAEGHNINYQEPCGSSADSHGNPETSVSIFPLHGWRNWGSVSVEECEWGGGSPFSRGSAFWYNSLFSYSCLPRICGFYIIWFIYREFFFQRFSWAVLLGFNPQETESWKLKHKSEKRRKKKKRVLQNDLFFKARDPAYRRGRRETHHSYWPILQEGGERRWDIWPPKQPHKAAPIWGN